MLHQAATVDSMTGVSSGTEQRAYDAVDLRPAQVIYNTSFDSIVAKRLSIAKAAARSINVPCMIANGAKLFTWCPVATPGTAAAGSDLQLQKVPLQSVEACQPVDAA